MGESIRRSEETGWKDVEEKPMYSEAYDDHPILSAIKDFIEVRNFASNIVVGYDGFQTDYYLEDQKPERKNIYNALGVVNRDFINRRHPVMDETDFDIAEFLNRKAPPAEVNTKSFTDVEEFSKKINGVRYRIAFRRNETDSELEYDYFSKVRRCQKSK